MPEPCDHLQRYWLSYTLVNWKDPECSALIRDYTNNNLKLAFDCISEGSSPKICEQAISSTSGGTITYLLKSAHELQTRTDVVKKHTSG